MVLVAIGFEGPERAGAVEQLDLELDRRGNIRTEMTYRSSTPGVYACGDARIGQSLVVTAIAEGRKCARVVNKDLGGSPMDADREMLAIGAWSGGEADRTLRHEAEAAGTVRAGEEFFTGPARRVAKSLLHSSPRSSYGLAHVGAPVLRRAGEYRSPMRTHWCANRGSRAMSFLRDLSVRWKLLGLAGVLVALMVVSGVLGIVNISSSASKGDRLYANATVPIEHLVKMEGSLGNVDTDVLRTVSLGTGGTQYARAFQSDAAAVEQDMRALPRRLDDPGGGEGRAIVLVRLDAVQGDRSVDHRTRAEGAGPGRQSAVLH